MIALLVFEENQLAEMLSDFLVFRLFICQLPQMMKTKLPIACCNCFDEHEPMVACWAAIEGMLVQVLKNLCIPLVYHLKDRCSQS